LDVLEAEALKDTDTGAVATRDSGVDLRRAKGASMINRRHARRCHQSTTGVRAGKPIAECIPGRIDRIEVNSTDEFIIEPEPQPDVLIECVSEMSGNLVARSDLLERIVAMLTKVPSILIDEREVVVSIVHGQFAQDQALL